MPHRVVLIDDDHGPMQLLVGALRLRGFNVDHFDRVDATFAWLAGPAQAEAPPDLVIVDMMMPPGAHLSLEDTDSGLRTGVEVAKRVRARFATAPIIVFTHARDDLRHRLPPGTPVWKKRGFTPFAFADEVEALMKETTAEDHAQDR